MCNLFDRFYRVILINENSPNYINGMRSKVVILREPPVLYTVICHVFQSDNSTKNVSFMDHSKSWNSIIAKYCFIIMIAKILYNKRHRIRHISTNYRATTYLLFSPRKYLLKVYLAIKKLRQLKLPCKDNNITFTS